MTNVTRILAPVDFSDSSRDAARYAGAIASRTSARLELLHVVSKADFEFAAAGLEETATRLHHQRMTAVRQALHEFPDPGFPADRIVAPGDPAEEIVRMAQNGGECVLVMPTRGAGAFRRWLGLGSVASQVLAGADCPVMTGVNFQHAPDGLVGGRIVCAVDLGPHTSRVLKWTAFAAAHFGAQITVVHALTLADQAVHTMLEDEWRAALNERVELRIQRLLHSHGMQAEILLAEGRPHDVVAEAAAASGAGWVVIGRSCAHDLLGRLRASAYEIIRRSPCPVISV